MKLKNGFITHQMDGEQIMVATADADFSGLVRSNQTAAFIIDCLKDETTPEKIVEALAAEYDAPKNVIAADVKTVLAKLRSIGAIDE